MADRLTCTCGAEVAFLPEDRGAEVYCPSCGRAVAVPNEAMPEETLSTRDAPSTVSVPTAPAREPQGNIFSDRGLTELGQRIVGHCDCLCGARIPTRLEDHGGSVYCPSCGSEVAVGQSLVRQATRAAQVADETAPPPSSTPDGAVTRPWRWWAAGSCLVIAIVAAAILKMPYPDSAKGVLSWTARLRAALGGSQSEAEPKNETARHREPTSPAMSNATGIEPSITLAGIRRLLEQSDAARALLQAEVWQRRLTAAKAPEGDARLLELRHVREALVARQSPEAPAPPVFVAEFQRQLEVAAQALRNDELAAAKSALAKAGELLAAHSELAHRSERLLRLEQRLAEREALLAGIKPLTELLAYASSAANRGQVTDGLKALAQARWRALAMPLNDAQTQVLEQRVRDVAARLKLAQGRRAIEDALACSDAGDIANRDLQLSRARSLLPGMPEREIRPLLRRADALERKPVARNARLDVAKNIAARDRFEAAVALVGGTDPLALASAVLACSAGPSKVDWSDWLRDAVLDSWLAELEALAADEASRAAQGRRDLLQALRQLEMWQGDPRWRQIEQLSQP